MKNEVSISLKLFLHVYDTCTIGASEKCHFEFLILHTDKPVFHLLLLTLIVYTDTKTRGVFLVFLVFHSHSSVSVVTTEGILQSD